MDKTSREYAEKMAEKQDRSSGYSMFVNGFTRGYLKAIEETNVKEKHAFIDFVSNYLESKFDLTPSEKQILQKAKEVK